jgi:hypothetical protein
MTKQAQAAPPSQPLPGAFFDVPGVPMGSTQWTDQDETTTNQITTHAQGNQVPINGIQSYKQTDVVVDWYMVLNVAQTYTAGTSTLTASAYAPMNVLGAVKQTVQNQYASVDVESGIDLLIFNLIRPFDSAEILSGVNNYANPDGSPVGGTATGYLTTALAQVNNINSAQWSTAATSYNLIFRLPAGQWFDSYYDLAPTGEPVTTPHPAVVSPQYMAGTTRVITPQITINAGSASTTDLSPVNIGTGTGTYTGSSTLRLRRRAIYAGDPTTAPPVYAWQYRWKTQRFNVQGNSRADLIIPLDTGQLLACYVRMFDPSAAAGLGAPINVNTVSRINLQYGSGLFRADFGTVGNVTAATLWQRYWMAKHGNLLPPGVMAFDLARDERNQMTNARAINTLTTAGVLLHLEWTAPLSSTAYAVLGTESLVFVS